MGDFTILCSGYTTKGELNLGGNGERFVLITNFDCSFTRSFLQSKAMMRQSNSVSEINRFGGAVVIDYPELTLNIDIEPTLTDVKNFFRHIAHGRNNPSCIHLTDPSNNVDWYFNKCYLTSGTLSIEEMSNVTLSLSFIVELDSLAYMWNERFPVVTTASIEEGAVTDNYAVTEEYYEPNVPYSDEPLIPYWKCSLTLGNNDITGITFSYSQNLSPQYECSGTELPQSFKALFFSLPEANLSINKIFAKAGGMDNNDIGTQYYSKIPSSGYADSPGYYASPSSNSNEPIANTTKLIIGGEVIAVFSGLHLESTTPSFLGQPSLSESYSIIGNITTPDYEKESNNN